MDIFKRILGSRFITIKRGIWIWINCMIIIYITVCLILAPFLSCSKLFIYLLRIGGDVYCIEGWSDFHFFCDFRKWAHCYRLALFIYCKFNSKKRQILQRARAAHARQNFHSFKITGTLKFFFFLIRHEPSFYIKDQLPKIEFKIRDCLVFFYFSKWKNGF